LSLGHLMMTVWLPFILMTITGEIDGQPIAFTGVAWSPLAYDIS
jgi:hypothetical protein